MPSSADISLAPLELDKIPKQPCPVISLSNFEPALQEIASLEFLGTFGELREWNGEFGKGKREKRKVYEGGKVWGLLKKGNGWVRLRLPLIVDLVRVRSHSDWRW